MQSSKIGKKYALAALAVAGMAVGLDLTILNVALPTLVKALHASTDDLQWFATAYNLVVAGLLLPAGLLGDRFGRKKLLLGAIAVFGAASALCAFSTNTGMLIASRVLLGLGAAFLLPLCMAVLPVLFPNKKERAKATTIWLGGNAISFPAGPLAGGLLLNHFWWGSVFLINVPVACLALLTVWLFVPESKSERRHHLDIGGTLSSSAALITLTYGLIRAGQHGWGSYGTLAVFAGAALLLVAFVLWEWRANQRHPGDALADRSLLQSRHFIWGTLLAALAMFAMFGILFTMPQYFQAIAHTTALGTGLRLLPIVIGILIGAQASETLEPHIGSKKGILLGFVLLTIGLVLGATMDMQTTYNFIALWFALVGVGLGLLLPATLSAAINTLTAERSGTGASVVQTVRQIGGVIGVAVLGSIGSIVYRHHLQLHSLPGAATNAIQSNVNAGVIVANRLDSSALLGSVQHAFLHAVSATLWVTASVSLLGCVLTVCCMPRTNSRTIEEPHDEIPTI